MNRHQLGQNRANRCYARLAAATLLLAIGLTQTSHAAEFHVSPRGDDTHAGTPDRPLASLNRAVEVARQAPQRASRRIVLHGGDYFEVAVRLEPADSGLVIEAAVNEQPVLHGGRVLTGFHPEEGPLVAADLPAADVGADGIRMLSVNGRLAPRARFPAKGRLQHRSEFNVGWMGTYGGGWARKPTADELTTLLVTPADLGRHFSPANAELTIFHEWDESLVGVRSFATNTGIIRFMSDAGHPPGAFGKRSFVLWNTRDGLTESGRWLHDRERNRIVYWPLPGEEPAQLRVVLPRTETVLRLQGTRTNPVRSVVVRGLTLAVTDTPLKAGGFGAYAFEGALTGEHLQDCQFEGLSIRQAGGYGIKLTETARCRITHSEITDTGAGGLLGQGMQFAEIRDNHIHNVGRAYPSGIGLVCCGVSNQVAGNFVHHTPYVGITCDGAAARIESNRIESVMLELHDGAGIYLGGSNHLIRANVCRKIGDAAHTDGDLGDMKAGGGRRHAYYMDELMRQSRLEGNLAVQCPSPLHNHIASDNAIVNNVFLHDGDLRLSFYRCDTHRLERNLVMAQGKIEIYGPEAVSAWTNNLFFSKAGTVVGFPLKGGYTPQAPAPLRISGVLTSEDPQASATADGWVEWPTNALPARLGISPPAHVGGP